MSDLAFKANCLGTYRAIVKIPKGEMTVLYCDNDTYTAYVLFDNVADGDKTKELKEDLNEYSLQDWLDEMGESGKRSRRSWSMPVPCCGGGG